MKGPSENSIALSVGGEVLCYGFQVGEETFAFTPRQTQFLVALQKMQNVGAAAIAVGKDEAWGQGFLKSPKFRRYIAAKMEQFSEKNSLTVDWWYQFGKWAAEGERSYYVATCRICKKETKHSVWEVETARQDDMLLSLPCPDCGKPLELEKKSIKFAPTRQQIGAWAELGARLIPKVERVQHQFERSEIIFETGEAT